MLFIIHQPSSTINHMTTRLIASQLEILKSIVCPDPSIQCLRSPREMTTTTTTRGNRSRYLGETAADWLGTIARAKTHSSRANDSNGPVGVSGSVDEDRTEEGLGVATGDYVTSTVNMILTCVSANVSVGHSDHYHLRTSTVQFCQLPKRAHTIRTCFRSCRSCTTYLARFCLSTPYDPSNHIWPARTKPGSRGLRSLVFPSKDRYM
jgi:hypothetical protein